MPRRKPVVLAAAALALISAVSAAAASPAGGAAPHGRAGGKMPVVAFPLAMVGTVPGSLQVIGPLLSGSLGVFPVVGAASDATVAGVAVADTGLSAVTANVDGTLSGYQGKNSLIGLSQFAGEGDSGFVPYSEGVALRGPFGLAAVSENGVVQLRFTHGQWTVDGRVQRPGDSDLSPPSPHAAGFIPLHAKTVDIGAYRGVAVSKVPLRNGQYLGLAIDRRDNTIAVIEGVGSPQAHFVGSLTSSVIDEISGFEADYNGASGTGGMAFSPATATRAAVVTNNGVKILDLSDPSKPRFYASALAIGAVTSVAISPDGDDVAFADDGIIIGLHGLLQLKRGGTLKATNEVDFQPPGGLTTYPVYAIAYAANGALIVERADLDPVAMTTGYFVSRVLGMATAAPHVVASVQIGGLPVGLNDLAVYPAGPTPRLTPRALSSGVVGRSLTRDLGVAGGLGTYHFAVTSGQLPRGLAIHGQQISGTPKGRTTNHFTVTAVNQYGGAVLGTYTLTIRAKGRAAGRAEPASYRYWPVLATVSMERPDSSPCLPVISVRM